MDFSTATEINAAAVMDRELMSSPGRALDFVHELQRLNLSGYLTCRSASGDRTGDRDERAFVEGFVSSTRAAAFADLLNTVTDKLAVVVHPVAEVAPASRVPVIFQDGLSNGGVSLSRTSAQLRRLREGVGLSPHADVSYVVCLDPLWGRPSAGQDGLLTDMLVVLNSNRQALDS